MKLVRGHIKRLTDLIEAEYHGRDFDRHEAYRLAMTLAEASPEIRDTMRRVASRMTPSGLQA
ncbi:hypothetical protein [Paramagnetospirillum magneticum]|uniref:Uncharacterized protein n=1 Tax=Paramagnetospirillum magneticum (strain ATCC 700264 / AMB-1) TaxID=342108 RepID=Q2W8C9_PARM1|nr:hypothetical protein [Paramagnetospirillum magneticum]BAE49896.1 hypothetical protein amb1092 [Paramagnetospirillum magneticum AMB-1]